MHRDDATAHHGHRCRVPTCLGRITCRPTSYRGESSDPMDRILYDADKLAPMSKENQALYTDVFENPKAIQCFELWPMRFATGLKCKLANMEKPKDSRLSVSNSQRRFKTRRKRQNWTCWKRTRIRTNTWRYSIRHGRYAAMQEAIDNNAVEGTRRRSRHKQQQTSSSEH